MRAFSIASARAFTLVAGLALLSGCESSTLTGPDQAARAPDLAGGNSAAHAVIVLNWNLYIGTDVDAVIAALVTPDPTDDLPALLQAVATLQATDFPSRAEAIADEIARERPHVVGLQEVSVVDIDLTPLGLPIDIELDFLAILQAALTARGLDYDVAALVTNTDAEPVPGAVRVIDRDALLVDPARVDVLSEIEANYSNNLGPVAPGVELIRGFVAITAMIESESYTFANTHLEPNLGGIDLSGLRALQAAELLGAVEALDAGSPAILMGDFNDVSGSLMHQIVTGAGFADVWAALRPQVEGLTCCHLSDLSNKLPTFDKRIDYVFARGLDSRVRGRVERLAEVPADRLPGPAHLIWPSDHAGLVADFVVPPAAVLAAVP